MKHLLSILISIFLFTACDSINENFYKGTLKAFNSCINNLESEHLKDATLKNMCAKKHQIILAKSSLTGNAGLQSFFPFKGNFEGTVENQSSDVVVTSFKVMLGHFVRFKRESSNDLLDSVGCIAEHAKIDTDGNIINDSENLCEYKDWKISFDDLWLEPNDEYKMQYDTKFEPVYVSHQGITKNTHWYILEVHGLFIE